MKKNTKLALLFSLFGGWAFAQNDVERQKILQNTNLSELRTISQVAGKRQLDEKKEALVVARQKGWKVFLSLPDGSFAELQRIDKYTGKPVYYVTESNLNAAATTKANKLWTGGGLGLNLNGQGMVAGEWDGGPVRTAHQEFGGRVTQKDGVAFTTSNGNNNHATHVGGTIIASGVTADAKGMAPQGTLWANDWNNDLTEMSNQASQGLIISNHSYGYNAQYLSTWQFGFYDSQAADWDNIAFNAPFYLIVKAAGNDRGQGYNTGDAGYDLVSGSATSKNALVVGAVSAVTNYTGASSVGMSTFSSWGPTDDGRIKPDVVGCGVNVYSTSSTSNTGYATLSGTSMASPNVTGTLTLIQQHYKNLNGGTFMRAATLKGLVIHTADEAGSAAGPDYRFGWGLVNAEKAANAITNKGISAIIDERTLNTGTTYSTTVIASGTAPLELTISWADRQGTPAASNVIDPTTRMLVNDLDIRVSYNGSTTFPWILNPASPAAAATKGDNTRDNVEKIIIENPIAGATYTVTVSHKGSLVGSLQAYSLIVTGIGATTPTPPSTCAVPASLTTTGIAQTTATLNWGIVSGASTYDVRLRVAGSSTWNDFLGRTGTSVAITGLVAATNYEWQIRTNCSASSSAYSTSVNFTTLNNVVSWCASRGNDNAYEWIDLVSIGSINRTSGKEAGGYASTGLSTTLVRGASQNISFSAAFSSTAYTEFWKIWIDYNRDGDFDDAGELVVSRSSSSSATLSNSFTVPVAATLGQTRMRVSMSDANQTSCAAFNYGEVEDYTVNITATALSTQEFGSKLTGEDNFDVTIYPNPSSLNQKITLQFSQEGKNTVQVIDLTGKIVETALVEGSQYELNTENFGKGLYIIQVSSEKGKITKKLLIN